MVVKKRKKVSAESTIASEEPANSPDGADNKYVKNNKSIEYCGESWLTQNAPDSESLYKSLNYLITAIAVVLRFWSISEPREVVFDEVHFGKFASYYLERTYFFDVHPPLAKMMIAAVGWLVGYNGKFKFDEIGYSYDSNPAPFVAYRSLSAVLGSMTIPIIFNTMKELNFKALTCFVAAFLVAVDNAHVIDSRLILLDAMLIFSIALSIYCYVRFYKAQLKGAFSSQWYFWLYATGVSLSLVMSTKYVGLLTYVTIGFAVALNLWQLLDIRSALTLRKFFKHTLSRFNGLIFFPFLVYLFWFYCHFAILSKSGPGDTFMSSDFQDTLGDSPNASEIKNVHFYDVITLKHKDTDAYLHSHLGRYPLRYDDGRVSSNGQQVTGYIHKDANNMWEVLPPHGVEVSEDTVVKMDSNVRLRHVGTDTFLLAHDVASPFYPTNEEITTVPIEEADGEKYQFTLFRFQPALSKNSGKPLKTKGAAFRIFHVETAVSLWTHNDKLLPEWGFGQQEVNGNKKVTEPENNWIVEEIANLSDDDERMKYIPKVVKQLPFFTKWWELQFMMFDHNNKLSSEHPFASQPQTWPAALSGVSFWSKNDERKQIFFTGNVIGWWFEMFSFAIYIGIVIADLISRQRAVYAMNKMARQKLYCPLAFLLIGWAVHYFPFFLMGRQKFLHHYLPAHMIAAMFSAGVWELAFTNIQSIDLDKDEEDPKNPHELRPKIFTGAFFIFCLTVVVNVGAFFIFFSPLVYGTPMTPEQVNARQWMDIKLHFAN